MNIPTSTLFTQENFWGTHFKKVALLKNFPRIEGVIHYSDVIGTDSVYLKFYNETTNEFQYKYFHLEDFQIVQDCSRLFFKNLDAFAEKIKIGPARVFKEKIAEIQITDTHRELLLFAEYLYVCGRYKWAQPLLFKDMAKDLRVARMKGLLKDCSEVHVELLLRLVAARIGYVLGNHPGD